MKKNNSRSIVLKKSVLAISIASVLTGILLPVSLVNGALPKELDIYKQPTQGKTTLLLMLDSSAGMDENGAGKLPERSIYKDYPNCRNKTILSESTSSLESKYQSTYTLTDSQGRAKPTFVFDMPYCNDGTGENKYSRQDRQKIAMTKLLSSTEISDNIVMGLGQMPTQTSSAYVLDETKTAQENMIYSATNRAKGVVEYRFKGSQAGNGEKNGTGTSAKILIPAQPLTLAQRWKMRVAVTALYGGGTTPLASGLAEAGAYMLGGNSTLAPNSVPQRVYPGIPSDNSSAYDARSGYRQGGFTDSNDAAKNITKTAYSSPVPDDQSCNASGIFLLTNAAPTETPRTTAELLMKNALGDNNFTCPADNSAQPIRQVGSGGTDFGWTCMGEFAKKLYNSPKKIKVAVAGFGNEFIPYQGVGKSVILSGADGNQRRYYNCNALVPNTEYTVNGVTTRVTQDTINACNLGEKSHTSLPNVGGYGQGGFFPIVSPQDLVNGIKNFVADLQTALPALNAGIPAIPVDTLNSTQQLPYAFYSQFQPNTTSSGAVGIWLGNIKKYQILENTYKDKLGNQVVNATGNLNSTMDYWNTSGELDQADATKGGANSKLKVQAQSNGRILYTNRLVNSSGVASELATSGADLTKITANNNATDTAGTAEQLRSSADPDRAYLLNLFGFSSSVPTAPSTLVGAAQLRQMGASLNSTPVFFTTKSKIATRPTTRTEGSQSVTYQIGDYIDRQDYVLFGTNQGLLQVVDASSGEEKFAFLPKEMLDKHKAGFIAKSLQTGAGYTDLYAGIDAPWAVYANYVSNNESNSVKANTLNVYGGLRRGGYNYYGLDLKDIDTASPKLLFKVGPSQDASGEPNGTCNNMTPINCMGQSWSKPTIAWIKWKGKPQLVMIVGGGYDSEAYDNPTYKSNSAATKGNGVYIFAANSNTNTGLSAGDLLWWGSSTASNTTATNNNETQKTNNTSLKYSVVSEIKSIDRDSDGFVDNLYFGDLGGQVFRVDINNAASTASANMVVKRITRIANFIADADRASKAAPRFYYPPAFTVHRKDSMSDVIGSATRYAVISIGSGDASSPVSNSLDANNGITNRVYGIFDRDVGRVDLYSMSSDTDTNGLKTGTASTTNMIDLASSAATVSNMNSNAYKGWYNSLSGTTFGRTGNNIDSTLSSGVARYKVLGAFAAVKGTLFTNYFDAADVGSSSSCSAGVKGRSYIKNYCLPFGSMNSEGNNCGTATDGRLYSTATSIGSDIGAGVLPLVMGGMTDSSGNKSIGPITGVGNTTGVKAQYKTPLKLSPLKWSEKNS